MALIRSVVKLQGKTGFPEDIFQNVWHFNMPTEPGSADFAAIGSALDGFYSSVAVAGATLPICKYMTTGSITSPPVPAVDHYVVDLATGRAGTPKGRSDLLAFAPGTVQPLPNEIAVVMSYKGNYGTLDERFAQPPEGPAGDLRPRARVRGRIFLGPWSTEALRTATTGSVPSIPLLGTIRDRAVALRDDSGLAARLIKWVVYSRAAGLVTNVTDGWVDDAFDTQRRRGIKAVTRGTW